MSTHRVNVGGIPIGGGAPVTIQTMTNTDTAEAAASAPSRRLRCFTRSPSVPQAG